MRKLTDDQAADVASSLVLDHLRNGVEFLDVTERVDYSGYVEFPTGEDYEEVFGRVSDFLRELYEHVLNS